MPSIPGPPVRAPVVASGRMPGSVRDGGFVLKIGC
jgi:hypothetical protein